MEHIAEFGDERQKAWCVHCGELLDSGSTRDHIPTRAFLDKPYPAHLPVVEVCLACNKGLSKDEQYFVALLGCIMSGTAEVDDQPDRRIAQMLAESPGLRERIASARRVNPAPSGRALVSWEYEAPRLERVIVKNARGHFLFECNEPMASEPKRVWFAALESLSDAQRREFEGVADPFTDRFEPDARIVLPELGSRAMTRVLTGADTVAGWIEVQDGVYRYAVEQIGEATRVRSVLREHMATEVVWEDR
ncbi:hypothetical protein [Mycobacterium sherrisii]|uniref:hypothetical protein n=1 Tax=Mycobacterium sherrisii TaxID=243061 RepID=UPI000A15D846|nr:hypothetical protein [Mycobacterium sherrisii]MCV7032217.1 hypothetical protein [Mycobacterium sherrisii]ORW74487.1 hypothetical protein AWC25_16045 [Mycobacterium sherrisii]